MSFIEDIYNNTSHFPNTETFGLVSQLKRASISVASNIAEGCARRGTQEKIYFFSIAKSSLSEIDAQLEISLRLKFLMDDAYKKLCLKIDRLSAMIQGLINSRKGVT